MFIFLGLRFIFMPFLASVYSFLPFIFIAECIGGIWSCSPMKFFSTSCICFVVGYFVMLLSVIFPSVS